jgi:5-(carboxyamino)imidazole ribonucleotide synthase
MMRLGILGGGQLARMLALAAYPLGIRTCCLDPSPNACAGDVTLVITGELTDRTALQCLLSQVDIVTYETENIPVSCAQAVAAVRPLYPSVAVLQMAQDRLYEKTFFQSLGIPTARFADITSLTALEAVAAEFGFPAILKTRRMGYDGKGQVFIKTAADIPHAWDTLSAHSALILEAFVAFDQEVSLISVRNAQGDIRFYPLTLNQHQLGILHSSEAPFQHPGLQRQAQDYATAILEKLEYVGVLAIEFFNVAQQLVANEMAPRVHNSGHWTIEGTQTSQFENHLRAVWGLPLGSTEPTGHALMINCIGTMPPPQAYLHLPGVHYHSYGKSPRPGRKLGHITLVDADKKRYCATSINVRANGSGME